MLKIYHSNRLDVLKELIAFVIKSERLNDPFDPEIIIMQNAGIAQWLQISLSQKFGIAANIEFPVPANFIWNIFKLVLLDIPSLNAFSKQSMRWKLMTLLPDIIKYEEFYILKQYLSRDAENKKLFQLTSHIADLYDKYLVYRPDWLNMWESGLLIKGLPEEQVWQASLWKALVKLTEKLGQSQWHYANLYNRFITIIKSATKPWPGLPSRIFICGISSLPRVYLNIFKSLSKHMSIHILFTNPCRHYWGDIHNAYSLEQTSIHHHQYLFKEQSSLLSKDDWNNTKLFDKNKTQLSPNPLLASWGKIGRDYIHMLYNISFTEEEKEDIYAFLASTSDSLLHNIQLDILDLENRAVVVGITATEFTRSDTKRCLDPNDRSLTIHVCHSLLREVEVLHDQLMAMLQDNASLDPRDIVVMVADIDSYSPFIQAVFGGAKGDLYIPYSISDRSALHSNSAIQAFINLLSLPNSRFISEDILSLLDVSVLAARFNINEHDLQYLRRWIKESGVRWGLDDYNVQDFELPMTGQHTWKFGIKRMLLGYAMESSKGPWKGVLPYDESSGNIAELVGRLASLLMKLTSWRIELKQARKLEAWLPICQKIMNDFFLLDIKTEAAAVLIEQQWRDIISEGLESYYSEIVPISLIREELMQRLSLKRISQCFISGSVSICTLMPIHSIPFKVICLLGMNDGEYPRSLAPLSFDLTNYHPEHGDHTRCDEDKYLFLEALISAQQIIYISYIGRSIQDNSKRFPSVLVQELMNYIGQSYYLPGDELCSCDESEQHVKEHITFHHSRMPFDPINYEHNEQQSYVRRWLPAAKKEGTTQTEFIQTLKPKPIEVLTFEQLQFFWSHPVRAFFQQRLKVNFNYNYKENNIINVEPFTFEGSKLYQCNQKILNALIEQEDVQILFDHYRAAGQLPYGNFGKIIWETQLQKMQMLAKRVIKYRQPSQNMEINLDCNGIHLTGWLHNIQSNGLLRWLPAKCNISQGLQLWLEHLIYIISGNEGESRLFVLENGEWRFPSIDVKTAQDYLNLFIEGYLQGMNKPLLLLPKSGWAWIKSYYGTSNHNILINEALLKQEAYNKFLQVYNGNMVIRGESKDIWYQRLWRTLRPEHFASITKEAQRYLLPLFKFNKS